MEKRNLPNATAVLVLGICSIVTFCCYGIFGLIFGIIALVLAGKDMKLYRAEPELYANYQNLNAGKIMAIVGVVLSGIALIGYIFLFSLGEDRLREIQKNLEEKARYQQEQDQ